MVYRVYVEKKPELAHEASALRYEIRHLLQIRSLDIRRITGYLVGTMDKWNDAKRAEERDRVKHGMSTNG